MSIKNFFFSFLTSLISLIGVNIISWIDITRNNTKKLKIILNLFSKMLVYFLLYIFYLSICFCMCIYVFALYKIKESNHTNSVNFSEFCNLSLILLCADKFLLYYIFFFSKVLQRKIDFISLN